tara:strand:+ start:1271 stop:6658 length:5388 start_codon:yes stop_codon:yes gene_type:complete
MLNRGLDPEEYESLDEVEYSAYLAEDWSKLESAGMGLTTNIGGGLAGAAGTIGIGAALSSTGVGAAVGVPLMLAGGLASYAAGNYAQGKIEDALYDDEELEALQAKRRDAELANPLSYFGGQMAPAALSFRPSPTQLGKAGKGLGQALTGRSVGMGEKQALGQMGFGSAIDTAFEGGRQLYEGEFDAGKLAMSATVGATLQKPTIKPKGIEGLIAKGREKAKLRPKGSMLNSDPDKVFNLWAEPIASTQELKEAIGNVGTTSIYDQGKIFTGDAAVKVGIVENAAAPTPYNVVAQIEQQVTGGAGILDPLKVGPAAESMRRPGIGKGPLTLEEAAAAQGVAPETARNIYAMGSAKEAEAIKLREEGVKDLKAAKTEEAGIGDPGITYTKREVARIKSLVKKAERKIAKADKQLAAARPAKAGEKLTISAEEKAAINTLFSGQAKRVEVLDPATGKPRRVKVASVPKEASERIIDRNGEPLTERKGVWHTTFGEIGGGLRILAGGSMQKSVPRKGGGMGWQFVSRAEAVRINKAFQDHLAGIRKNADEAVSNLSKGTGRKLPPLNKEVYSILSRLALVRGFNLTRAISNLYTDKGRRAAGFQAYDTRSVTYDPKVMGDDLMAHEGFHGFLDDLQYSTSTKDQKLRDKFLKLFDSEEQAVEFLGRAMAARVAKRKEATFKELLREARLRWKDKFGIPLTSKQLKDYLLIKYEHDAPFIYNKELLDGFVAKNLGEKPTDASRSALMNAVQAGNPVPLAATAATARASKDPWKDLKFQEEKVRYNSRNEVVATEKEVEEGFSMIKKSLGMPEDTPPPEGGGLGGMLNKVEQDTGQKFQEARGERTISALDEGLMFASGRDRSRHMVEVFDKFNTSLDDFNPERTTLIGGDAEAWSGLKKFVDPVWWVQRTRYAIAETDQLLVRPFQGLKNADIADSTKKMALYIRDAHNRLELMEKRYVNKYVEPLVMSLGKLSLSKSDKITLGRFRTLRRLVKKNFKDLDSEYVRKYNTEYQELYSKVLGSSKLGTANKLLDDLYVQTRDEHIANGPKMKVGDLWRDPKAAREGYYDPFMLSRDATTVLRKKAHTEEGQAMQEKILKFWLQQREARVGIEDELRSDLREYIAVISNKDSYTKSTGETVDLTAAAKFNALRKTEGLLMPPDLVDPDPFLRAQRYVGRFAKDMSRFTQIEDDHIVRAVRDLPNQEGVYTHRQTQKGKDTIEPTTPTLKELFGDDVDTDYGSRAAKTFSNLDETHAGFHTDVDIQVLRANRMITSQWLGALSGVRDITTSFMNNLPYLRLQDMPLILKSVTHLGDAWKQSHISGANRSKLASIEFAHDSVDRAADAMATVADFSQKYSGRELFERGTRAIQFNLGKLLMRSYLNSSGKDPHIQRVLTTMGRMADIDTGRLQKNPTTVSEGDLNKLATAFVEINQGTYGARGVPSAMIRGKSSWFLSLSRWSVEKFNRYMKDVVMPISKDGDFRPLLKATLGAAVTGEALQEVANMINAKESYEPSFAELVESDADFEEYVYHAMHVANLAGFFGVLSGLGNDVVRMTATGKGAVEDISAITFPALEALLMDKGIAQSLISYGTSDNVGDVTTSLRLAEDIMTNLNQTLRIGRNQMLANTDAGKSLDEALGTTYFKGRASEMRRKGLERDLKVFNRLYRGEHGSRWFANIDRYARTPATNFKHSATEADMRENVQGLMENAWKRSQVKDGVDARKFDRLLKEGYSKPSRISPKVTDAFTLREAQMFADYIARLRSDDAVRTVIEQEDRDEALAVERKRIIMESLPQFIRSKQ